MWDGGLFIGRNVATGVELSADKIQNTFATYGIESAICSSYKSIYFDFREGNQDVLDLSKRNPGRVVPSLIIPPVSLSPSTVSAYLKDCYQQGARVLGFYHSPKYYEVPFDCYAVRGLAKEAAKQGYCLQFGLTQVEELSKIADLYGSLECPILIRWMTGRTYKHLTEVISVHNQFKNFYVDVGSVVNAGGIRLLVEECGSERLYAASNIPEALFYPTRFIQEVAEIKDSDRQNILGKNLARIFNAKASETTAQLSKDGQERWERLKKFKKIDTHVHLDGWNILEPEIAPQFILKHFENLNYQKVIIIPVRALNDDLVLANAKTQEVLSEYDEFFGMIVVDPLRPEDSIQAIEAYSKNQKFVGLKSIQDLSGILLDDAIYDVFFEAAEKYKLPVMAHIPGMLEAAKKHPGTNFLCAHSNWGRIKHFVPQKNIYFDIATSHADTNESRLDLLIEKAGVERIIYSCDAQLIHPAWTLGKLASYEISDKDLEKIFYQNAKALFPRIN